MDDLLLALLEALVEGLLQVLIELAFEIIKEWFEREAPVGLPTLLICGGATGGAISLLLPSRLLPFRTPISGLSLVFAPLVAGACMHFVGEWRRRTGHKYSTLSTFAGGAIFAFGMALARFLMVGLK